MSIASGYGPNWTTAESRGLDAQRRIAELEQQLAAAQGEARELRALVTEFANFTRDSGWLYVADELEQRLAAIASQPAEQPADRKRRGEPVAWPLASPEDAGKGWTLDYRFIERVERAARQRTDYTTSMEATEQVLIAAAEVLGAPQTAEYDAAVTKATAQASPTKSESLPLTFTQGVLCSLSILDRYGDSTAYREVADPHDLNQLWEEADEFDREHLARHGYRPTPAAQESGDA